MDYYHISAQELGKGAKFAIHIPRDQGRQQQQQGDSSK